MSIQSIRGMQDILPSQTGRWQAVEDVCRRMSAQYGYREIRTPVLEKTELFVRGVGEGTDIVGKEMYTFPSGSDSFTLRPELTAGVARSVIQHNLMEQGATLRLWYYGPLFRHERPQEGRYRQFYQYGAELLGSPYPESDVEVIQLAYDLLRGLGLTAFTLKINTLGTPASRQRYREALLGYLRPFADRLSEDSQRRLEKNPLRILDSKNEDDRLIVREAPVFDDYLDEESRAYFASVQEMLTALAIPFVVSEQLVRGLDYYSHTVFEFTTDRLGSQDAIGGGGRYDGLFEQLGGKRVPGVGFASGIERLLLLLEKEGKTIGAERPVDLYIAALDDDSRVVGLQLARTLRARGLSVLADLQRRSFKAQMKEADRAGALRVAIIGEDERRMGIVRLKTMATGEQSDIALDSAAEQIVAL